MSEQIDYTNPLHAASLYVEDLKYGVGPKSVERVSTIEFTNQLETMLDAAGQPDLITNKQFLEALDFYGMSYHHQLRLPYLISKSIFADGVLHGMALAFGLKGDPDSLVETPSPIGDDSG